MRMTSRVRCGSGRYRERREAELVNTGQESTGKAVKRSEELYMSAERSMQKEDKDLDIQVLSSGMGGRMTRWT